MRSKTTETRYDRLNSDRDSPSPESRWRSRALTHLSVSILGALFVFAIMQFEMDGLRGILVDGLFRLPSFKNSAKNVTVVAYDDSSSERFGYGARFPVAELEAVFKSVVAGQPAAIAVLGAFNERIYSNHELATLNGVFGGFENTFVGFNDDESLGHERPKAFTGSFPYVAGFVSRDTFSYGGDSVSRRVMTMIDGQPTLFWLLSQKLCIRSGKRCSTRDLGIETVGNSAHSYIQWRRGRTQEFSSAAIVKGEVPPERFKGRIVVIGTQLSGRKGADHILTPFSRSTFDTPMLEGAAQSIASLVEDDSVVRSPFWMDWLIAIAVGILTVNLVLAVSPGRGILCVFCECLGLVVVGWVLLRLNGIWLDLAHPLVIACVGYYLVIPYRLVDEYRKRWHYQEKSELMGQLEQLKSNFLSLVSHDLKTPIARIQGNAELMLEGAEALHESQRKSLSAIVKTTENLSQYVESILDITRVESARVPLNKSTRDINSTVLEVIEEKSGMAAEKQIELKTQLDPIFSMRYDVKLMKRVIANLVENAIQYSPPNSQILLRTIEEDGWVKLVIKDEGVGISKDDAEKVFFKFYRCGNDVTQKVKGTGLGLYLVKYFVELHLGIIELESDLGHGSTFTVSLPVA